MTKPPRASDTPKRFILRWDGANGCYKVSEPGIGTHEVIFAEEYDKLEKQLSAANAALKEARDKALDLAAQECARLGRSLDNEYNRKHFDVAELMEPFLEMEEMILALKSKRDGVE